MFVLSEQQVNFILDDIRRNGIELEELQLSLLDHICCVIEEEMSPETNFETLYSTVLPRFFEKELREIQEETDLLITFKNYYAMKKVMLNTGIFSAFTFIIGAVFKMMHWPGAGVLLLLPIAIISLVFLPLLFLIKSKETKEKREKTTLGVGVIFGIVLSLSGLFKVMHWPGANAMWLTALAILFLLFLPMHFFGGIRNPETKTNTIISSILILMAGGLFFTLTDLSSTREKLEELSVQTDNNLLSTINFLEEQNRDNYALVIDSVQIEKNKLLQSKCDILCTSIANLKLELMKKVPGQPARTEEEFVLLFGFDFHRTTSILFNEDNTPHPILSKIKNEINDLNTFLINNYGEESQNLFNTDDRFDYGSSNHQKVSWEIATFNNVQAQLVMRILNQLVLDVRLLEANSI